MPEAGDETQPHTHTHEGTSLNLRRTVFDASKVRGPVMHKHSRQPRGPQVQSTEAARVARIKKKTKNSPLIC